MTTPHRTHSVAMRLGLVAVALVVGLLAVRPPATDTRLWADEPRPASANRRERFADSAVAKNETQEAAITRIAKGVKELMKKTPDATRNSVELKEGDPFREPTHWKIEIVYAMGNVASVKTTLESNHRNNYGATEEVALEKVFDEAERRTAFFTPLNQGLGGGVATFLQRKDDVPCGASYAFYIGPAPRGQAYRIHVKVWRNADSEEADTVKWREKSKALVVESRDEIKKLLPTLITIVEDVQPTTLEDDGFWQWLTEFHALREKNQARVAAIKAKLAYLRGESRTKLHKWLTLMRLDMQDFDAKNDLIEAGFSGRVGLSRFKIEDLRAERQQTADEIHAIRPEQEKLIQEGIRLLKELIESPQGQAIRSRDQRPELKNTIEEFKDQYALGKLALYDSAGWHDSEEMAKAIEEGQFQSKASREVGLLMKALGAKARAEAIDRKVLLQMTSPARTGPNTALEEDAQAARMEAIQTLRELLTLNPQNSQAQVTLADLELRFVKLISAKLEQEKKLNFAAFRKYLSNRGYGVNDKENPERDPAGWWEGFKELASVWWGSGPITLGAGLPERVTVLGRTIEVGGINVPDVIAGEVDLVQMSIAKNQVSLLAIRRLIRNGVSVSKILQTKPDELAEKMAFSTLERKPLDPAKARRICQDIHETFAELYDLRALADGDYPAFWKYHRRNYYELINPDKCWGESIGDFFFSPSGLLTWFGPSAITRVNGQWVAGYATGAELSLLEGTGRVERGRDLFVKVMRLEELGQMLNGANGGALQRAILADQKFLTEMYAAGAAREEYVRNFLRWATNSGARFAAVLVFYGGASHLAEESGIPGLQQLVDALGALGVEEIAFDVLSRSGTPLRKFVAANERMAAHVAKEKVVLAETKKMMELTETISASLKSPEAVRRRLPTPNQIRELETIGQRVAPKRNTLIVPGANRADDAHTTLTSINGALQSGNQKEAENAIKSLKSNVQSMEETLDVYARKCAENRSFLNRHPNARKIDPQVPFKPIEFLDGPELFVPEGGYHSGHGEFVKRGDEALRRGDFEQARNFYLGAAQHADIAGVEAAEKALIEGRLALARDARDLRRRFENARQRMAAAPKVNTPIEKTDVDAVVQQLTDKTAEIKKLTSSANPVYLIQETGGAKQKLMVFKLTNKEHEITAELLCTAALQELGKVAPELGINVPACRRVKLSGIKVKPSIFKVEANGLCYRYVDGTELEKASEPKLAALKDEIATQHVFRIWFGDGDGHFRNQLESVDYHVIPIDFGKAHLKRDFDPAFFTPKAVLGREPRNQKEFMEAVLGFPKWVYTEHKSANGTLLKPPLYGWMARIEQMLKYDDMVPAIDAIKKLCGDNGAALREAFEKTGVSRDEIEAAVEVLVKRSQDLDKALKRYPSFPKTSLWLPSPFRRPGDLRLWALAA